MKKGFKFLAGMLAAVTAFGVSACGKTPIETGETDGKRIEVKAVIAGYGTDWLSALASRFNEIYKAEGYEVVITQMDTELGAKNEISYPKKCTTDIFFEYNNADELLNKSYSILRQKGQALLDDLSDVYKSPAIGADKQSEGKNIIDRMESVLVDNCRYHGTLQGFDGIYGIPWQGGYNGIYVNKVKLAELGFTTDNLLTTDDLKSVINACAPEKTEAALTDANGFFPVAWSQKVAPGYWDYMFRALMAQYEGTQSFENFVNFVPDDGTTVEKGYTVYEKRGILEALKVIEFLEDRDLCVPGTSSMDHITAESRVATGKSLMVVAGDYMYKELEKDYSEYYGNILPIKWPVISALGVKLGLCGASHAAGDECSACNVKLREIVKAVDEGKTNAEIVSALGATEAAVKAIREARCQYMLGEGTVVASIPAYSDAKKGAKLFLRFMYSDEGMQIFRSKTYVDLPASYTVEPEQSQYEFVQKMFERNKANDVLVRDSYLNSPIRRSGVTEFPKQQSIVALFTQLSYTHSHGSPNAGFTPQEIYESNISWVKSSWGDYIRQAGLEN